MASIFSKIISGEIPCYKIYEDEHVFAFLDPNPMQKGHTLVVPKNEVDYLFDLSSSEYNILMEKVKHVAEVLKTKLNCKRVCVLVEGYQVPHAHVHLVPTNSPDDFDKKFCHKASDEELMEAYKMLTF